MLIEQANVQADLTVLAWAVGVLVLITLVFTALAPVWPGTRRVVTRRNRVRRVFESGVAWRVPGFEHFDVVVSDEHEMPLEVPATTVEGRAVLVEAEVAIRVAPPEVGRPHLDAWAATEPYASDIVSELVATRSMAELPLALGAAKGRFRTSMAEVASPLGVDVLGVHIIGVEPALPG